jgi:hypothetical protein
LHKNQDLTFSAPFPAIKALLMAQQNFKEYLQSQQVALQWHPFLRALASELAATGNEADLRQFFFRVGEQYARDAQEYFENVQNLQQLEELLNLFWSRINWGWVEIQELKGFIEIAHHASPLAEAFGYEALRWSVSLLEGFYQTVFSALGASERMRVRTHGDLSDGMSIKFRFGQA